MYEDSSNVSYHCILATWDSYRPYCRQSWPIIAYTGYPDRAYSVCGTFSGPLLLLRSLRAQSMPGVTPEVQVNRGPQMRRKGQDYGIYGGTQGFVGPK